MHCVSACQVCSRRLCGYCRLGFVGERSLTVCGVCHRKLLQRQAVEDQALLEQNAFDRWLAHQRILHQAEMLRLNEERLRLAADAQAARFGTNKKTLLGHAVTLLRFTGGKVIHHVRRALP